MVASNATYIGRYCIYAVIVIFIFPDISNDSAKMPEKASSQEVAMKTRPSTYCGAFVTWLHPSDWIQEIMTSGLVQGRLVPLVPFMRSCQL